MKHKILCVDDEIAILELLRDFLIERGFEVAIAQNADSFKKTAFEFQPELIILDIMLGDRNGAQVHSELTAKGFDRNVPVIFLSGLVSEHQESFAKEGRNTALLAKPFKPEELLEQIRILLKSK